MPGGFDDGFSDGFGGSISGSGGSSGIQWSNGKMLWGAGGKIAFDPSCCICGCASCTDATPPKYRVTLTDVTVIGACVACFDGSGGFGATGVLDGNYELDLYSGTLPASLLISNPFSCCWHATITTPTVRIYDTTDCSDAPLFTITTWDIWLCRTVATAGDGTPLYLWWFEVSNISTPGAITYLFQPPLRTGASDNYLVGTAFCSNPDDLPVFSNADNGSCGFGGYQAASGGTAVISLP